MARKARSEPWIQKIPAIESMARNKHFNIWNWTWHITDTSSSMHPQNTMHCAELQTGLCPNRWFESPPVQVQHCYLAIAVPSQFLFPNKEMDIPNRCDNHAKITFLASHRAEERTVHIHEKAYSNRQVYLTSNNSDPKLESVSKSSDKQRIRNRSRHRVTSKFKSDRNPTDYRW